MNQFKRIIIAACCSVGVTACLVFFMLALIQLNEKAEPINQFSAVHKVSHAPGLTPSRDTNDASRKRHYQLPSKRQVRAPLDLNNLMAHTRSQLNHGDQSDRHASPMPQQLLLTPGHQSQASVRLDGLFNISGPAPRYPAQALLDEQEGWVEAMIHLKQDGSVSRIDILDAGPKGVFEDAILAAVIDWRVDATASNTAFDEQYKHRFEFQIKE